MDVVEKPRITAKMMAAKSSQSKLPGMMCLIWASSEEIAISGMHQNQTSRVQDCEHAHTASMKNK